LNELLAARPSCARYFELLDRPSAMDPEPQRVPGRAAADRPAQCAGELELRNVSFRFGGREADALRGVSLRVRAGETVAIVGPSGSGKSSLVKLLLRLYDPAAGLALLDGRDLRGLDLGWLRRQFGYVPQSPSLFDETVAHNLALGVEPRPSEDALWSALEDAGAAQFVRQLPLGLNCRLGEGGSALSGGQRQRIALARSLLRSPTIFVFDEATSSLDMQTERVVQESINRLRWRGERLSSAGAGGHGRMSPAAGRPTVVLVAHRLDTVAYADRVVVLVDGVVVEEGSPRELATGGGWFERNFYPNPNLGN
jgi:ATP-binding cassette subfamily B protein